MYVDTEQKFRHVSQLPHLHVLSRPSQRPLWCICALKGSSAHQVSHCSQQNHRNLLQKHFSSLSLLESSFKMSRIIVYSQDGFGGQSAEFNHDVRDKQEKGFNDPIASIKVIGKPWVAYYDKDFAGWMRMFEQGEYAMLEDRGRFSSFKMVTADLANPEIKLFEHSNYGGRSVTLFNESNFPGINFNDEASSHIVKGGVWVLYEHTNRRGAQLIAFPGDRIPSYGPYHFNDAISCVRPLLPMQ
ncbi:hypothetical protein PO909_029923 [Leuciscus waleckii]